MSEAEDNRLIEAILASGVKIPSMPAALMRVLALMRDDDAGPHQFATEISRDPGMTGAVYRVVGSPVMGLRTRIDSLEKAVALLGIRTTVAVVRSEAMRSALHEPGLAGVMNVLWVRSNTIADYALGTLKSLRLRGLSEDLAFQAGIFHDCGVAVLCRRDPVYAEACKDARAWPDILALDAARGTSHTVVGLMIARNWQLPAEVAQAIRLHHDRQPEGMPERVRALCVLIQFARHLLAKRMGGSSVEWETIWKSHAEALFRQAGRELPEMEEEMLNLKL